jgi:ABC-type multidrug transport system fused ATPase/permease subunit
MNRICSAARSPIVANIQEAVDGSSTIRAYGLVEYSIEKNNYAQNRSILAMTWQVCCRSWFNIRVNLYGNIVITAACIFSIVFAGNLDPIWAAMTLNYVMTLQENLQMFINLTFQLENQMINANRCMKVSEIIQEKHEGHVHEKALLANERKAWPERGELEFKNVFMRYRPNTELVLKDLTFKIEAGHRIGVVGRTGAGKSTLANVITRICEIEKGQVTLDGVDISRLDLQKLRESMTIIP